MHNPNSAVERIKNHLAYKLGQAMIEYNKNGGGYLTLFKKLYNIKKQHKKEKQIYQETIKVFPTLKYPELKQCPDYNEALKCYFHLSYMLGEVLIKTFKTWYKGSIFTLAKNIKKANKEFKLFQDIFKEFDQINSNTIEGIVNNKQLFFKELPRIKNLLNIHKDYKPIIENIFHNFDYVTKNFNLIEEWLLSNDFNEKYKKENHPYPSLLDPKKLNDEKEEINYKTIPAELAWEMNLPLPDNYEFVFLLIHGAGTTAMTRYLRLCNISLNRHWGDPVFQYLDSYCMLIKKSNYNVIILAGCLSKANFNLGIKFYNLIQKKIPAICVVRDPISVLRPIVNHYGNLQHPKDKIQSQIDIEKYPVQDNFKIQVPYAYPDQNGNPTLNTVKEYADDKYGDFYILSVKIKELKHRMQKLYYLDMNSILPENSFETLLNLSKIFHFTVPKSSELFFSKANSSDNHVDYLFFPKKLYLRYNNEDISLEIIKQKIVSSEYLDYTKYFTNSPFLIQEIGIKIILHKKYLQYFRSGIVYEKFSSYLHDYLFYLEQFYNKERKKIINEQEILDFMKSNPEVLKKYKLKLDKELVHIKEHRPDIVASWKYYQEFEKMCEELD